MIRSATFDDFDAILPLISELEPNKSSVELHEYLFELLASDSYTCMVWDNSKVDGFVGCEYDPENRLFLRHIVVDESQRGTKIGSQLVDRVIRLHQEIGTSEIYLYAPTQQMSFYLTNGFTCDPQDGYRHVFY